MRAHATWLDANAVRQLQTYRTFVGQRSSSAASELPTAAPEASISSQDSDDEDAGSSRDMQAAAKSIALASAHPHLQLPVCSNGLRVQTLGAGARYRHGFIVM